MVWGKKKKKRRETKYAKYAFISLKMHRYLILTDLFIYSELDRILEKVLDIGRC